MFCVINLCQNAYLRGSTEMKPPFLPFDEPNQCNDYILRDSEYIDRFYINFPCHYNLNQVHLDTNLLNNFILTKVVLQTTKKTRSTGPHKSKSKKTTSRKKSRLKKQEIQECEYTTTWRICRSK